MNKEQAYEAYRLECAKREGFSKECIDFNGIKYKDDNDIDRIVRLLSPEDKDAYCDELIVLCGRYTPNLLSATIDYKRLALYKVFGIEVTE